MNTLYYGDNLNILRRYIRDESVDLVYLDPPFNSHQPRWNQSGTFLQNHTKWFMFYPTNMIE